MDALTGDLVSGPAYPRLPSQGRIVAWRGETAYAVVQGSRTVMLARMTPHTAAVEPVLIAPPGTFGMAVATHHVDTIRPTGKPATGVNVPEVLARTGWLAPPILVGLWLVLRRFRRPKSPGGDGGQDRVGDRA